MSAPDPRLRFRSWLDFPMVQAEHVLPLVAGEGPSEGSWLLDLFAQLPIPRQSSWLVLGCGGGELERLAGEKGLMTRTDGFDSSPAAIEAAQRGAAASPYGQLHYAVSELQVLELPAETYDVAVCNMMLHRVADLEGLLTSVRASLRPGGWLLANAFVGPARFQYSDQQMQIVEELLGLLPDWIRTDYFEHRVKEFYSRRPLQFWEENAPLEAVSSQRIEPLLRSLFTLELRRDYGGTLLNPLLENIVGNFTPERESGATILRLLMYVERVLLREGVLASDFAVLAARKA